MTLPLQGVRVVDFTRVLTGPYATMLLGDLGADVIKIEPPQGDDTRAWGPPFKGTEATYYLSVNRNKRSIVLDLKNPDDVRTALDLIATADVLVENYRPGTMDRLGLGWEELHERHPSLVYAAISGFGQSGPYRDLAGYDIIAQGMSGLMSYTGDAHGEPMKLGVAVADVFAGALMTQGILAALFERERSGTGRRVDVNLLEGMMSLGTYQLSRYLNAGEVAERLGNEHRSIVPYGLFRCQDGFINLAVGNDGLWRRFCSGLDMHDLLADERYLTNAGRVAHRDELVPELTARFGRFSRVEVMKRLQQAGVPCGPVYDVRETFEDPHVQARELTVPVSHPTLGEVTLTSPPWEFDGQHLPIRRAPPTLGQHDAEIRSELTQQHINEETHA
ncbi:CaiB/BaiF CoA transferase family protein [Deinococcus peraridilitoris]|uniref:Putative acyl-CoA transferase/carnitine dehydratase n=1 Tax=Deinococcus peraridilitoris (strain DSM 19664 / LMG 22246 / CIP 109416 / KR-200) TaxID=937777 RepID=L0A688_DEIPD|nr:CoA transferase [Deinococcus peraridilitoris]AFZ68672.1 putative acyl-CoA transferase/carnitine dehydratase [Deinococcus peraridilitoris DSM 19664]